MSDFDVIVVGSGAGGGVAAWKFARRGMRVLVLERGTPIPPGPREPDLLRNQRYGAYGISAGPDVDERRVFVDQDGREIEVGPLDGGFNNNAMTLGGGTRVFAAQAWRFHDLDFRMASTYGVPSGSSLADWPIDGDELAPYYEEIEWSLGVCGEHPAGRKPLPMPPMPLLKRGTKLLEAAQRRGWSTVRIPQMINSIDYAGRSKCLGCRFCVGFTCPNGAKGGTANTVLPVVASTEGCEIWSETKALKVLTDGAGRVTGVRVARGGEVVEVSADVVVVAGGAIESARLLLASPSAKEPNGLGNNSDQVGRNLQGHYYPGAVGLFDEPINEMLGPGPSIALNQFNHGNSGVIGGSILCDDSIVLPTTFAARHRPRNVPGYGLGFKRWMRHAYLRTFQICGPTQDIPSPDCRVTLSSSMRDRDGIPVARLSGTTHPETVRTAHFMAERAAEWLLEAGATQIDVSRPGLGMSGGQHQAGTCRMGNDPSTSVVDARGRVHGHENLLVCDTSVHVTNGGFNPFLTAMATSLRTANLF